MLIIMANYSGAGPEDISELVTEPIEGGDRHDGRRGYDFLHIERWTFDDHASSTITAPIWMKHMTT